MFRNPLFKHRYQADLEARQKLTTALLESAEGENDRRNYFMIINLHENMWPGRISNQRPMDFAVRLAPKYKYRISY